MNLPNRLTLLRFVLAFILIFLYVFPFSSLGVSIVEIPTTGFNVIDLVCTILFIVASITDLLDPLADKFLVNSSLILLAVYKSNLLPAIIVILMIGRDLAVDGMRFIASSKGEVIAANIYGKLKTVVQMVVIPVIFLNGFPFNYLLKEYTFILTIVFASIALFFSLLSGIIYIYRGRKFLKD